MVPKKKNKRSIKKPAKKLLKKTKKKTIRKAVKKPVKAIKRKAFKKKLIVKKKPAVKAKNEGNLIGVITHYFPHVQAAVIKLKAPLSKGENVKIKGHTTDITQIVSSLQIDRADIQNAKKGDEIGLQVVSRVRRRDKVYKV